MTIPHLPYEIRVSRDRIDAFNDLIDDVNAGGAISHRRHDRRYGRDFIDYLNILIDRINAGPPLARFDYTIVLTRRIVDVLNALAAAVEIARTDTTAPTLSTPTDTKTGSTTATLTVDTDEGAGVLYVVVTQSATPPDPETEIALGLDENGDPADFADDQAVASTGTKSFSATGLTHATAYYAHFAQVDAHGNWSLASSGNGFTTDFDPAVPFVGRSSGAWFTAYNATYLESDRAGGGGAVTTGNVAGRWLDRSGFANHVSSDNDGHRPYYRTGEGLNFFYTTSGAVLRNNATTAFPRAGMSGGLVAWLSANNQAPILDIGASDLSLYGGGTTDIRMLGWFDGAAVHSTTLPLTSRKTVITWRSNGSNLIFRMDGVNYSGSPLSASSATRIIMNSFNGGLPQAERLFEVVLYDYDIGAANLIALETYLRGNAGSFDATRTVVAYGDSLTVGQGSQTYKPWMDYVSNRSGSQWFACGYSGGYVFSPHITAANLALLKGTNEGVAVLWIGTNDIHSTAKTGLQTAALVKAYSDTLRTAGMKVVACALQDIVGFTAEVADFNTQLAADSSHYDAIVSQETQLSDNTNTTYFTADGVHLVDAGYAIRGASIQTAMASIPAV